MEFSIKEKLRRIIDSKSQPSRGKYIGASSIGHACERKIWYQYQDTRPVNSINLKFTFDIGNSIEKLILDYLDYTDVYVVRPSEKNNHLRCYDEDYEVFNGHMDAIIEFPTLNVRAVMDVKTAKASSFQKFVQKGLKLWNVMYFAQLQAYMGMTGIKNAILFAVNKDTSDFHEEWIKFDADYYKELKTKAIRIASYEEEPERINKNPCYYLCSMCGFKEICHSE